MSWQKDEVLTKLEALIDDLVNSLPIDRSRIYLSGYSMGGQGVGKLIERRPTLYAAALFAEGGPKDSWVGKTKAAMWSYYSNTNELIYLVEWPRLSWSNSRRKESAMRASQLTDNVEVERDKPELPSIAKRNF